MGCIPELWQKQSFSPLSCLYQDILSENVTNIQGVGGKNWRIKDSKTGLCFLILDPPLCTQQIDIMRVKVKVTNVWRIPTTSGTQWAFSFFFFNSGEDRDVKKNSDGLAIFSSIAEVKLNAGSRSKKGWELIQECRYLEGAGIWFKGCLIPKPVFFMLPCTLLF